MHKASPSTRPHCPGRWPWGLRGPSQALRNDFAAGPVDAAATLANSTAATSFSFNRAPIDLGALESPRALQLRTLTSSTSLSQGFDQVRQALQANDGPRQQQISVASSAAVGTGLSVGYVVWLLRSGVLLSSVLSALPAWQLLDPLPVLARPTKGGGALGDEPADDVERLFDGDQPPADPAPGRLPPAQAPMPPPDPAALRAATTERLP